MYKSELRQLSFYSLMPSIYRVNCYTSIHYLRLRAVAGFSVHGFDTGFAPRCRCSIGLHLHINITNYIREDRGNIQSDSQMWKFYSFSFLHNIIYYRNANFFRDGHDYKWLHFKLLWSNRNNEKETGQFVENLSFEWSRCEMIIMNKDNKVNKEILVKNILT